MSQQEKIRVMVIDDSQSMRSSAASVLKHEFEVLTCEDGMVGISNLNRFRPHIIFMDIVMPKIDGFEAVALIRMNDFFKQTPILMMSSKGGIFDVARGRLLGFTGSIIKPFQSNDLIAAIRQYVVAHDQ